MKPENRKQQIVEAAIKCFATRGYHATSISCIIEEAEIARGTFYLYFKGKHDIFQMILDDYIGHISQQIRMVDMQSEISPIVQMGGNIERIVDAIMERPELSKILFNEAVGLDDETQQRLREFYGKIIKIIVSSIKRGKEFGIIKDIDPEIAACIALGTFKEVVTQTAILGNVKIPRKNMIDGMMNIFFTGAARR